METVGRSADGKRVVVALDWHEIQTLLDSAVQDSGRRRRNAKKVHDPDGVTAADFALNTANALEAAWFDTKRQAAQLQQVRPHDPNYRYEAA